MDFGTLVLSEKASLLEEKVKIEGVYHDVTLIRLAKFIYQRPDTSKMILEIEGLLFQEDPANVYLCTPENLSHFKDKIRERYSKIIRNHEQNIQDFMNNLRQAQLKIDAHQLTIVILNERLKVEFTEGRAKQIVSLSKNLRKKQRIASAIPRCKTSE
ncbi:hypothetical protein JOD82_002185 [Paenibacillus sp. 1182]|uniref:hypothetical protein n=1 Tax=Paenibacillus sp. 1182 TaxID=2806565 RepID=UPI001AE583C2|nr:hypothetical protein [Paenibacillus sp. 1182]MBP1309165.1 hypothetical protein [Paenibacillus sp. 1182]